MNFLILFEVIIVRIRVHLRLLAPKIIVLIYLIPETSIRFCPLSLLPHKLESLERIPIVSSNEVDDYNRGRSWDTCMAMHQNIQFLLPLLFNPSHCFVEVLDDRIFKNIFDGQYFMTIYSAIQVNL